MLVQASRLASALVMLGLCIYCTDPTTSQEPCRFKPTPPKVPYPKVWRCRCAGRSTRRSLRHRRNPRKRNPSPSVRRHRSRRCPPRTNRKGTSSGLAAISVGMTIGRTSCGSAGAGGLNPRTRSGCRVTGARRDAVAMGARVLDQRSGRQGRSGDLLSHPPAPPNVARQRIRPAPTCSTYRATGCGTATVTVAVASAPVSSRPNRRQGPRPFSGRGR